MYLKIKSIKIHEVKTYKSEGETDNSSIIVREFNICLRVIDRRCRQKISNDIVELNGTINQLDLIDIYRMLHSTVAEHTFFSSSSGTFTKIWAIKHTLTNLKE